MADNEETVEKSTSKNDDAPVTTVDDSKDSIAQEPEAQVTQEPTQDDVTNSRLDAIEDKMDKLFGSLDQIKDAQAVLLESGIIVDGGEDDLTDIPDNTFVNGDLDLLI